MGLACARRSPTTTEPSCRHASAQLDDVARELRHLRLSVMSPKLGGRAPGSRGGLPSGIVRRVGPCGGRVADDGRWRRIWGRRLRASRCSLDALGPRVRGRVRRHGGAFGPCRRRWSPPPVTRRSTRSSTIRSRRLSTNGYDSDHDPRVNRSVGGYAWAKRGVQTTGQREAVKWGARRPGLLGSPGITHGHGAPGVGGATTADTWKS